CPKGKRAWKSRTSTSAGSAARKARYVSCAVPTVLQTTAAHPPPARLRHRHSGSVALSCQHTVTVTALAGSAGMCTAVAEPVDSRTMRGEGGSGSDARAGRQRNPGGLRVLGERGRPPEIGGRQSLPPLSGQRRREQDDRTAECPQPREQAFQQRGHVNVVGVDLVEDDRLAGQSEEPH